VKPTGNIAKSASTPKPVLVATLRGLLHVKGNGASKTGWRGSLISVSRAGRTFHPLSRLKCCVPALLCAVVGLLVFTTAPALAAAPEVPGRLEAKPVAATTATLRGVLNPGAVGEVGSYEFLYKRSATECEGGEASGGIALGLKEEAVEANLTGLLPGAQYTFCLLARNEAGETALSTPPATFTTLVVPPTVEAESESASEVTANSVTLHAVVDPGGAATTYHFDYGTSEAYGQSTPESLSVGSDDSAHPAEAHIQGLAPNTLYHYRVVATSSADSAGAPGLDQTFTTQQAGGEFALPDGRQYEMVTPPEKEGALFDGLSREDNIVIQASVDGDAIADMATQPTEGEPQSYANDVSVLSTRDAGGWSSQDIAGPHDKAAGPGFVNGQESRFFSENLSHVVTQQIGLFTPLSPEASEQTPYVRTNFFNENVNERCEGSYRTSSTCFQPLVTSANTPKGTEFGGNNVSIEECIQFICGPLFVDATPDLSHIVLESSVQLTSTPGSGYYEWSGGQLQSLPGVLVGPNRSVDGMAARHAISADGERVLFESGGLESGGLGLFEVAKRETVQLDSAELGCGSCESGSGFFETASSDDSRVFFLDEKRLTANSGAISGNLDSGDLYECEMVLVADKPKCNLSDLTPPLVAGGEAANVVAVLGASEDGSYVYFAAAGRLTPGAASGECMHSLISDWQTEGCNVYVRHNGVTQLVSHGWLGAASDTNPQELARVSPDGRWLAFMSPKSLTGYDTLDAASGQPDAEVYLYHAETSPSGTLEGGKLTCASCNPTGAQPAGASPMAAKGPGEEALGWNAASIPSWTHFQKETLNSVYQSRYLSDSGRLFFDSNDALVPQDVNGTGDVYEYEPAGIPVDEHACSSTSSSGSEVFKPAHAFDVGGVRGEEGAGCVALISSGASNVESSFLDASESGDDVFFLTASKLAPQDFDTALDVYDAHECTSASPCIAPPASTPPPCATEASCKSSPTPQPGVYGLPSSATFSGPGNVTTISTPVTPKKAVKKAVKKVMKCKKGQKLNHGKCTKAKAKKKKKSKAKKSTHDKGSK
jgi:hypothetical protein